MSLSKLPLECLELVLQVLQDQKARGTLASLLRVNRFICAATLPCLYSQALTLPQVPSTFTSRVLISPAQKSVIQLLLRQRPAAEISELLNLAYDVFPERQYANNHPDHNCDPVNDNQYNNSNKRSNSISPKKPSFDYISFIPNFDFESYVYSPQCRTPQLNLFVENYPPHLASYAFRTKTGDLAENFGEGAHDENLLLPLEVMTKGRYTPKMIFFRYGALSVTLRRDLTWTLCSPVLEQIQSLIVPLSDIDRYLNAIERFESLKSVTFMVDEVLDVKADHRGLQVDPNSRYSQQLEEGLLRQNHQFTSMIEFVRLHSLLFRGQLRTANCSVDYESCPFRRPMECPHEILQTMKDYLPPLDKPRSIGPDNWQQISRKIHATDL
ncbi:hypothetical protein BGZ83_003860, partial [Gryganskiella cystojenkinii]